MYGSNVSSNNLRQINFPVCLWCQMTFSVVVCHKTQANYFSVKLSGPQGLNSGNGSVLYYLNDTWTRVCDESFDDVTARRVCRELGFADGRSICCSAYGGFSVRILCWGFSSINMHWPLHFSILLIVKTARRYF